MRHKILPYVLRSLLSNPDGGGIGLTEWRKSAEKMAESLARKFGLRVTRYKYFPYYDRQGVEIIESVKPYTMTDPERIFALINCVRYIVQSKIPGDIVECGVWRGGSMMAAAKVLLSLNESSRRLYLFDTFEGMPKPSEKDISYDGRHASELFKARTKSFMSFATLRDVKDNMSKVGYERSKIHFVKGLVEETIPARAPTRISLLRLDTDLYSSTRHELQHLFPRLSHGGVIVVDDYGYWLGSRKAMDEYMVANKIKLLLHITSEGAAIGVKI